MLPTEELRGGEWLVVSVSGLRVPRYAPVQECVSHSLFLHFNDPNGFACIVEALSSTWATHITT
jgi:hypothetical protein